jgi:hypothetical protein
MTSDEQNEFLRNAAQWQEMTPQERRLWRDLVQRLPPMPPMPPGFRRASPGGLPPMPPGFNEPSMPNDAYAKSAVN